MKYKTYINLPYVASNNGSVNFLNDNVTRHVIYDIQYL